MKLKIIKNGTSLKEKPLFSIEIGNKQANIWYKEVTRRFLEMAKLNDEQLIQEFVKKNPVFDIDEAMECGIMSLDHTSIY